MKSSPLILNSMEDVGHRLNRIQSQANDPKNEAWLQELLYAHPELMPVDEFDDSYSPAIPIGREVDTDRGPIDNLYVSPEGGITVVETKLWKNPEKHRTVVAQVIDYAKELATWDYDQLCTAVLASSRRRGEDVASLEEKVAQALSAAGMALHEFQENVAACLTEGNFLLLIVGDRISPNIALLTKAIQSAPGLGFMLGLAEMQLYEVNHGDDWPLIVVPEIVGRTVEKTRGVVRVYYTDQRPVVTVDNLDEIEEEDSERNLAVAGDEEEFFRSLAETLPEAQCSAARAIVTWMKNAYGDMRFWKGGKKDGASGNLLVGGKGSPFSVKPSGHLQVNFGWMKNRISGFDEEKRTELRLRFNQIKGVELSPTLHPTIPLSALSDEEAMHQFLETADWCVGQIREVRSKSLASPANKEV